MADWTTNKDLIQKLYIAFYGRPADPGGLRYWASQLPDNAQPNSEAVRNLIDRFINSPEAESRFGSPSLDAVIDRVINFAFHRDATEADREGVNDVVDLLLKVISVSSGPDFASLNNKLQYANWFVEILDPNGDGIPNDDSTGTKFMATYSGNTDANNVASKLNFIDVSNPATKAMVTDDIKNTVADPGDAIFDQQTGQTFTLTQNADNIVGTGGDDIFVATETTLSSADTLDGKGGNDTLRYASSGNVAINEAGFEIRDIENVQITSDAVGGTTFDFTGAQGVKTIINFNSSNDLIITGLKNLTPTIELRSLGAPNRATNIVDTTIIYDVAATKGTADAVQINVSGNLNTDGSRVGTVTANGVEIFNINSTDSASAFDGIASNTLREMNITGDANLTLNTAFFTNTADVNNVNAKDFEGNLNITLSNSGAANIDVSVTGGKGNDRADFSNGFDKNDAFDGGDGTDTLALTNGVAVVVNPADFGTVSNVEILEITDGGTNVGANVLDMDNFAGVGTVYYSGLNQVFGNGLVGATTIQDTPNTFTVKVNNPNAQNLTVNVKTDGASDELNLQVERVAAGEALNVVTAAKFETVNLDVADDPIVVGTGDLTINQLAINAATTLNITGSANVTINNDGNPATAVLTTLNAGQLTGSLTLTGVDFAKGGATITLGPGNDTINVANAPGADVYDITAGGKDTIVYTAVPQSDKNMDTIRGFTSGEDIVDVRTLLGGIGVANSTQFVGNRPTFGQAQGALIGKKTESAVFQQDEQILWVDANGDGTLDNNDFRVKLEGVSSVVARDLGFVQGVTFTANTVGAFSTLVPAHSVENNAVTPEDDTINATVAQINSAGTLINGLGGADVLNISGTAAAGEIADLQAATFLNVETVNLAANVEGVKMDAANLGNDAGQTSKISGVSGTLQSLDVNTSSDLSKVTISNIEILIMTGNVKMKLDQHNAFQQINAAGGADTITLTTAGTLTGDADVETYVLANGVNTFTLGAAGQNVTGGTGDDTVQTGGLATLTGTIDLGNQTNADVLKVTVGDVDLSGANLNNSIETLDVGNNLNVKMTVTQHNAFTTINAAGNNTITLADAGTLTGDADVETYVLADGANDFTLGAAGQNVTGGTDDDTVQTGGLATLTGNINLGGQTVADVLKVTVGDVDLSGATLTGIETLHVDTNLNVTLTAAQFNAFNPANFVGTGNNTITFSTQATGVNAIVINQTNGTKNFETFVFTSAAADDVTFKLANGSTISHTVDISAGGADKITLNNVSIDNGTGVITVNGFSTDDKIVSQVNSTSIVTGAYVTADAGNKITGQISGNVIEIHSTGANGVQVAAPTNDASLLAALNAVLTNGGTAVDIGNGDYTVIAYNGNNAYIYQVNIAGGDGTAGGDDTVELIGILNNVGADVLTAANFA